MIRYRTTGTENLTNGMTVGAMPEYSDYCPMDCESDVDQYNAGIL